MKRTKIILALTTMLIFTAVLAGGCLPDGNGLDNQNNSQLTVPVDKQKQIEALVDEIMKSQKVPGVVVGIWEGSKEPYILAKGIADISGGRKIDAGDRYRIGSVSKTFEALVVYQLCQEGKMSLQDPLSKWFPDFPNGDNIKVLQLLNMTSGIHDLTGDEGFSQSYYNEPEKVISREEEYRIIVSGEPQYEPGERCVYNDAGYILLAMIIEKASGNKVEDEIKNRICVPLKLEQTALPVTAAISGTYSKGYRENASGELEEVLVDPSYAWAAGAMVSNLYDMKTYVKALYDGSLISADNRKSMQTWHSMTSYPNRFPHTKYSNINVFYGAGLMNWGGLIGHNGTILGYNDMVGYIPSKDTTVIIWVNKCNDLHTENPPVLYMQDKILNILYGEAYPFEGLPGI